MPSSKTIILAAMPNIHLNPSLQSSPAFRKTIVPGGPGKSLLGIRPAVTTLQNRSTHHLNLNKPVSIEIKLENQLDDADDSESQSSRKRQRLDHLTMEEKLMRRKLKNRVAAQTARDRKKARMDELEDLVSNLEKQVEHFRSENGRLHNMTLLLESENILLKEKLEAKAVTVEEEVTVKREMKDDEVTGKTVDSIEHAWLISAPLQKEQDSTTCPRWTKPSASWQAIIMSLMIYLTSCNNAAKISSIVPLKKILESLKRSRMENQLRNGVEASQIIIPQWWGPQQKSWNPSKN